MNSSANPQCKLELQQGGGKLDRNDDGDGDASVDDAGDDTLASNDLCSSKDAALCKIPLHISSGGEVFVSYGNYECRISDHSSRGESILQGGGGATWYGQARPYQRSFNLLEWPLKLPFNPSVQKLI
jgi:hypothetical protein